MPTPDTPTEYPDTDVIPSDEHTDQEVVTEADVRKRGDCDMGYVLAAIAKQDDE